MNSGPALTQELRFLTPPPPLQTHAAPTDPGYIPGTSPQAPLKQVPADDMMGPATPLALKPKDCRGLLLQVLAHAASTDGVVARGVPGMPEDTRPI